MSVIHALRSRIARLLGFVGTLLIGLAVPAQAAFARVDPGGPYPYPNPYPAMLVAYSPPASSTRAAPSSGLAVWLVIVIAVAAVAVGIGLAELVRSMAWRQRAHRIALGS
jgi:hypothetical protein